MRCVRCEETWFAAAPATMPEDPILAPVPSQSRFVSDASVRASPPSNELAQASEKPRSRGLLGVAWLASVAVWAGALYMLWAGRETLMALWPPMARLYALLGPD